MATYWKKPDSEIFETKISPKFPPVEFHFVGFLYVVCEGLEAFLCLQSLLDPNDEP